MYRGPNQQTLACDVCNAYLDDRPRGEGDIFEKAKAAGWTILSRRGDAPGVNHICPDCTPPEREKTDIERQIEEQSRATREYLRGKFRVP